MQPWIRIRQQLYRRLEAHVRELLGPESQGTSRYRREYEKEFRRGWKPSTREALLHEIQASSIVLMGDFHALQQSQKAQLRILKALPASTSIALGVEFLESRHQKDIDRYLAGQLSERDFLKAIQWQKNWGFPWEHFRPLMRWAQKRKIPVYGLNKRFESRSASTLEARDRFSAERIRDIKNKHPNRLLFVVYGDLHLAGSHLPKAISRAMGKSAARILTIFQNSERLYFRLLEKGLDLEVDVVRLSKDQYCLLNVPPWVKWQNYLLFLENHLDKGIQEEVEYTDEVENYLKILRHDLGVSIPEGTFSVHTPNDSGFWDKVTKALSDREKKWFQAQVERGASFYLPAMSAAFLARPSVNHAAALAMAVFHSHVSGWRKNPSKMPDEFLKLIWLETVQYFGTKLINPKRKTDTLQDIKSSLAAHLPGDQGKEALQLALAQKMTELLWLSGIRKKSDFFRPRKPGSYQEAARLLGGMLGEKLFLGYRQKAFSKETLMSLIRRPVETETFDHFYYEVLELIESLPEPFLSKTEKL
jgi:hypothetical protein